MLRAHRKFSILGIWIKTKILKDGRRRKNEHNEMPYKTLSKFYLWLFKEFVCVKAMILFSADVVQLIFPLRIAQQ